MGVGAELNTLADLHTTFKNKAEDAESIKTEVDKGLSSAVWTGKYSEDFRNSWEDYKKNLDTLREALNGAAEDVKTNHNNIAEATGEPDRI
ncbi:type VII secretion system (Wss) protein ESAT-6 [Haloactinopolyspora alba]|uniref:Type VII secretion system (Wss) protein ESAT-6 n=1 Tax=Haloactinopolyspora alba TaxID=648780 RepID=A0A2P8EBE1_9ACTN|nr:WXG100 family type VII secretion target [Haloactinopolyspora alba]PSL06778.1 type VII secretion system (Wss) protein ESAT-6 [Haloactinopolyspora alba]